MALWQKCTYNHTHCTHTPQADCTHTHTTLYAHTPHCTYIRTTQCTHNTSDTAHTPPHTAHIHHTTHIPHTQTTPTHQHTHTLTHTLTHTHTHPPAMDSFWTGSSLFFFVSRSCTVSPQVSYLAFSGRQLVHYPLAQPRIGIQ